MDQRKLGGSDQVGIARITWIAGGGASGTVDDLEGVSENRGERKRVVNTAPLDLAVYGGESAGNWSRGRNDGGDVAVRDLSRRRHYSVCVCVETVTACETYQTVEDLESEDE